MSLHVIIDTTVRPNNQSSNSDYTFYFDKLNIEGYNKIKLKSLYIQHENDVSRLFKEQHENDASRTLRPLRVHCSLLNKDYNWLNGKKSDVLAVVYPPVNLYQPNHYTKNLLMNFEFAVPKLFLPGSYLRLELKNCKGEYVEGRGKYYIFYEFEFLQ